MIRGSRIHRLEVYFLDFHHISNNRVVVLMSRSHITGITGIKLWNDNHEMRA